MPAEPSTADLATRADSLIVWLLVGLVALWVASFLAETVMAKLKPVVMFMVAACLVGVVIMNVVSRL